MKEITCHRKGIAVLLFFYSFFLAADEYVKPNRHFSISTGYLEKVFNSNEALVEFPLGVIDGYGALFDLVTNSISEHWWARLLISIGEIPISYWLGNSLFVPFHEFGHARVYYATGRNYSYGTSGYGKRVTGIPSYWILSLARLVTPPFLFPGSGDALATATGEASINSALNDYWGSEEGLKLVGVAAGLNNQTLLAKRLAEEIYKRDGHITQTFHYLLNKVAGFGYSLMDQNSKFSEFRGDPTVILEKYQAKGYSINYAHLKFQSLLSLLSGTTYALVRGYYHYLADANPRVTPAEIFGVRIPDINSYINARGLSLELVSGYRVNQALNFGVAYEFIWKGDSAHQVTPSASYNLAAIAPKVNSLWLNGNIVIGKGLGGSIGADWMPFSIDDTNFYKRFSYFADVTVYNAYTLYGERNIPFLRNSNTINLSGFAGLRLNY